MGKDGLPHWIQLSSPLTLANIVLTYPESHGVVFCTAQLSAFVLSSLLHFVSAFFPSVSQPLEIFTGSFIKSLHPSLVTVTSWFQDWDDRDCITFSRWLLPAWSLEFLLSYHGHGSPLLAVPESRFKSSYRDSLVTAHLEDGTWVVGSPDFWVLSPWARDSHLSHLSLVFSPQRQDSALRGTISSFLGFNYFNLFSGFTNCNLFSRWPLLKRSPCPLNAVLIKLRTLWLYD